jgi:two-component system cell cycle response regulator
MPIAVPRLPFRKRQPAAGLAFLDDAVARRVGDLFERASSMDTTFRLHSRNVAVLSSRIGTELGIDGRELELLTLAASVHDVGKLSVPARILAKAGPLDDEEWEAMRRHPAVGADLLAACAAPSDVLRIVRSHHERWDGGGYPDGLAGETIPHAARIVAVVDAYCAMVEQRPYRPPRRPAQARAELLAGAGNQFDAECARVAHDVVAATG